MRFVLVIVFVALASFAIAGSIDMALDGAIRYFLKENSIFLYIFEYFLISNRKNNYGIMFLDPKNRDRAIFQKKILKNFQKRRTLKSFLVIQDESLEEK